MPPIHTSLEASSQLKEWRRVGEGRERGFRPRDDEAPHQIFMVTATPTAGAGGGGVLAAGFYTGPRHYQDQLLHQGTPMGMAVPGMTLSMTNSTAAAGSASFEDPSKKTRKPYTITKSRESWADEEHDKFLEALQLFDRDWKKIEAFVGSKSAIQIRSHAQKYFLKVQKNGTSEHVPPPRPKRKAAHPYPQKASKNAHNMPQPTIPFQTSSPLLEPGHALMSDSSLVVRHSATSGTVSSWVHGSNQPAVASYMTDVRPTWAMVVKNCSSSSGSPPRTWQNSEIADGGPHAQALHAMPDFVQVYSFIGSVFDPSTSGHLQKLKEMDPINVETVLLLMRNLCINLKSPHFEDHTRLLSYYDAPLEQAKSTNQGQRRVKLHEGSPLSRASTSFFMCSSSVYNPFDQQ